VVALLGGFAASRSEAHGARQMRQSTAKTAAAPAAKPAVKPVAKPAPVSSFVPGVSQRGSLGGPISKGTGINGTGIMPKQVSR